MPLRSLSSPSASPRPHPHPHFSTTPNFNSRPPPFLWRRSPFSVTLEQRCSFSPTLAAAPDPTSTPPTPALDGTTSWFSGFFINLAASAVFLLASCARASQVPSPSPLPPTTISTLVDHAMESSTAVDKVQDEELSAAFEQWKSKTYALTVPLRIIALRGSVPPSWIKEFIQTQGRRLKLSLEFRGTLETIFSDLSSAFRKSSLEPKSAMSADIVSIGDSWLRYAIGEGLIVPIQHAEEQDWFKCLSDKWKVHLCRDSEGEVDSNSYIWAAPYRWGSMVIAYKKNKFQKHKLTPIEDWSDLWRPELAGKISMVDSPREVIGAVLKHMGASYNTKDIDSEVNGGKQAVLYNLTLLQRQVQLFDNVHYMKAFATGDVWVAVGWSSDVIPAAKRMSNVAVVVPKSGASLWADLWVIPSATRFSTDKIGGRVRSPSPLIHQWIDFCLQTARWLPFQQDIIPGASPFTLEQDLIERPGESMKAKPKLDTNLIDGMPPPEILARCEFLEPLQKIALEDYKLLISGMQNPRHGFITTIKDFISYIKARSAPAHSVVANHVTSCQEDIGSNPP